MKFGVTKLEVNPPELQTKHDELRKVLGQNFAASKKDN